MSFPRWKKAVVIACGTGFYLASGCEALTRREDWPLSSYPMYSRKAGDTAIRQVVVGLSDHGELKLSPAQTDPLSGQRLKVLSHSLAQSNASSLRSLFLELGARYERRRTHEGWPKLLAIRAYDEFWRVLPELEGIDKPRRTLLVGVYFPPQSLLDRLTREANGTAVPEDAIPVPSDDVLVELDSAACEAACGPLEDRFAAGGSALRLAPTATEPARVGFERKLSPGSYFVYLRMRTQADARDDHLALELDGAQAGEVGNYRETLVTPSWVWASAGHGAPPLSIEVRGNRRHRLVLTSSSGAVVDQFWLSRAVRELPTENRIRTEP